MEKEYCSYCGKEIKEIGDRWTRGKVVMINLDTDAIDYDYTSEVYCKDCFDLTRIPDGRIINND